MIKKSFLFDCQTNMIGVNEKGQQLTVNNQIKTINCNKNQPVTHSINGELI